MPAKPWANSAQIDFLKSRRLAFSTHQSSKSVAKFWSEIYREFFEKWPDASSEREGLTEKEKASLPSTVGWTEEFWVAKRKKVCILNSFTVKALFTDIYSSGNIQLVQ